MTNSKMVTMIEKLNDDKLEELKQYTIEQAQTNKSKEVKEVFDSVMFVAIGRLEDNGADESIVEQAANEWIAQSRELFGSRRRRALNA